jgi:hypothetical protein
MSGMTRTLHDSKVRELADRYEAEGFRVIVEPGSEVLPFELGNYHPDLVAQKQDEHVIVEVKEEGDPVSVERFRDIAEEIRRHPGWRFLLVTTNDLESGSLGGMIGELSSWQEATERVARAERLLDQGNSDAAFFLIWSAFEAILRRHAESVALPIDRLPTLALLKHLYSQGELSIPQYDRAMAARQLRNRLAHGFEVDQLGAAAEDLRSLVNELLNDWNSNGTA